MSQLSMSEKVKAEAIRVACAEQDLDALVELATSEGGLLDDNIRQKACGLLILISLASVIC